MSKYLYVYIAMMLFYFSLIFLETKNAEYLFIVITLVFLISLLRDFFKSHLIFKIPNVFVFLLIFFILSGSVSDLFDLFGSYNPFVIIFIVCFLLMLFFKEKKLENA